MIKQKYKRLTRQLVYLILITSMLTGCCHPFCSIPPSQPEELPPCEPLEHPVRLALVLGGGGARGMAHVGVLKEFEEANIPVDLIVGCSAGSMVGFLYCHNPNADDLKGLLLTKKKEHFIDFNIWRSRFGLGRGYALRKFLYENVGDLDFCDLQIPLLVVATDLWTGDLVCIGGGEVVPAVHASCALPFYFTPVPLYGRILVDGGVADLVPVDTACTRNAEIIVAVDLSECLPKTRPTNLFGVAKRSAEIKFLKHNQACLRFADVVIKPDLGDIDCFEDGRTMDIYEAGRQAAKDAIPYILEMLQAKNCVSS